MSNVIHFNPVRVTFSSEEIANESRRQSVFLREVRDGLWIVHDESDSKGGCFRDRASAFKFVANEFGAGRRDGDPPALRHARRAGGTPVRRADCRAGALSPPPSEPRS